MSRAPAKKPATATETPPAAEALLGSSILPATFDIGGETVQLGTIVAAAHAASGLTVTEWNGLIPGVREALLQGSLHVLQADANVVAMAKDLENVQQQLHEVTASRDVADARASETALALAGVQRQLVDATAARETAEAALVVLQHSRALPELMQDPTDRAAEPGAPGSWKPEMVDGLYELAVSGPAEGRPLLGRVFATQPVIVRITVEELDLIVADPMLSIAPAAPPA